MGKVGAHLSGGLDSSSVAYFAATLLKKENKKLYTYSSVPPPSMADWTPPYLIRDETPYIKETVQKVGNIVASFERFYDKSPIDEIDEFLDIMEMPYKFFENTYWLKGIYEKASRNGIKVMLNGARGNHSISWGSMTLNFDYYTELLVSLKWRRLFHELDRCLLQKFSDGKVSDDTVSSKTSGSFNQK